MGSDILYLEKSNLLAQRLIELIPQVNWNLINDEAAFFDSIFQDIPLLIILGDTGSADVVELLFCLKSITGFNQIPVVFYGENEYNNILPVKMRIHRSYKGELLEKDKILNLIEIAKKYRSSHTLDWKIPKDYKNPDFNRKRARSIVYENLFQGYLYNEITGMNIVDLTFKKVLKKLCKKLETLLLLDFVFIIYMENNKLKGILQLSKGLLPDIQKVLIANCVSISKIKKDISKDQIDILITKENLTHNIAEEDFNFKFNENVVIHNNQDINLVMGSFSKTEEFPKQLSFNLLKYINEIINKAFLYYSKIEESQVIFKAFCQFLPAPIINDLLLKDSEKALLTGQKRNIVVLFSHIHHFDQIVELNEPQRVVDFLNSHFSRMVKIIQSYGGTVDKFIGDAIFAIFGAPISYIDNAQRAADAAADMIKEFNSTSLERIRLPALGISAGVGLNEGEAIIGNIGCADKFDYTAIGDTVNLAARLESLTKFYKQDILVSKVVAQKIDGKNYCRLIDRAKVKGKNEPTEIYSLILRSNRYTTEWKSLYNRGFKMYTLGNWYTAADYFNEALEIIPSDPVCKLLLSRCLEFQINIPENWDGSVALDFK